MRLLNTVGPRQTGTCGMAIPAFVIQVLRGEPLSVFGDGTPTRCFISVDRRHRRLRSTQQPETRGRAYDRLVSVPVDVLAGSVVTSAMVIQAGRLRSLMSRCHSSRMSNAHSRGV